MAGANSALVALLTAGLLGGAALAQDASYDNPNSGTTPCIVLNKYEVRSFNLDSENPLYRAQAEIENICGRTMDVAFCFVTAEPINESDRSCYGGMLRPGGVAEVENPSVGVRVTGPDIQWRYHEIATDSP